MVHYKLKYFPGRGAAEVARQVFALAEQDYDDIRIAKEDWPKYKNDAPFGQMPILEVDGKELAQSDAISRYLAKQFGFAGKSAWEEAQVDALADQWKDFRAEVKPYIYVVLGFAEGDKEKLKNEVFVPALQKHFPFFIKFLKQSGSGFLVGSSVTWIDLQVAEFIATLSQMAPEAVEAFPDLKAHCEKVHSIEQIKKWREKRPVTAF